MKRIVKLAGGSIIIATLVLACQKEQGNQLVTAGSTAELQISDQFSWSASMQGKLSVIFDNPENVSVDNETLYLRNDRGEVLEKTTVYKGKAQFDLLLPAQETYELYYPYTGSTMSISGPGKVNMPISASHKGKGNNASSGGTCTVCNSPIVNNLAENPVIRARSYKVLHSSAVPGWETTASDNAIEIWSSGFNGVPAAEGNQFFEINANRFGALYQSLCLEPGSTIKWSVYHRGRAGVDVAEVKIGATVSTATTQATMSDGKNAWGYYSGTYKVPTGQANTVFVFEAISAAGSASIGNFLDNFRILCDEDGDGVVDSNDDFPKDSTRAFAESFPTSGKQVVAFEDLWPSTGDYDFNDLILSQQVTWSKHADGHTVQGNFKVSIDAIGAGLANGIALLLRDANNQVPSASIIASLSGDVKLDPNNTNGLIVSNHVFKSLSEYYKNNGQGPTKAPDTLRFTINFKATAPAQIYPELYLFRSSNRGLEVHLPGMSPSKAFNAGLQNTKDDNGNFKTASNLPWALEIITSNEYKHPLEKVDMVQAFPQFALWATSGGSQNATWYNAPVEKEVFKLP